MALFVSSGGYHLFCPAALIPVFILTTINALQLSGFDSGGKEYCNHEIFRSECSRNQVIVVKEALYGRMQLGRCVRVDIGHLGCYHDVLPILDHWCSGRISCEVRVAHPDFVESRTNPDIDVSQTCLDEVKSYLKADYSCVEVLDAGKTFCSSTLDTVLTMNEGFLASITADNINCGSVNLPWLIQATAGQQIELYLYDFGFSGQSSHNLTRSNQRNRFDDICLPYGYIVEKATRTNKTICGGRQREGRIYASNTHYIQIQILRETERNGKHFMLHYKFNGCLDLPTQKDLSYVRDGENLSVTCTWTKQSWRLTCKGNEWHGVIGNCSHIEESAPQIISSAFSLSDNMMMILIGGSVILIVILLIVIIAVFLYRYSWCTNRQEPLTYENKKNYVEQFATVPCDARRYNYCSPSQNICGTNGKEFVHIWQRPLPAPLIPTPCSGHLHAQRCGGEESEFDELVDKIQPTLNSNQSETTDSSPKYYVLEPSHSA